MNGTGVDIPGPRTVLIADDEPIIRGVLETLVKESGYIPTTAADGQEAVALAASQEFEVALLDIGMPKMTGLEVLAWLRKNSPDTSVLMITAMTDVNTAVEAMRLGAYDWVSKPFNVDDVLLRVEKAREHRHLALLAKNYQKELDRKIQETETRLREQFEQRVLGLAREHTMAIEIEILRHAKREKTLFSSLPKELQQPKASVEEFVQVLIGMIRSEKVG